MGGVGPARKYPTWVWNPLAGGAYVNSGGSSKRFMPSTLILMVYLGVSIPYAFVKTAYEEVPKIEGGGRPYGLATPLVMRWRQWYSEARKGRTRL